MDGIDDIRERLARLEADVTHVAATLRAIQSAAAWILTAAVSSLVISASNWLLSSGLMA